MGKRLAVIGAIYLVNVSTLTIVSYVLISGFFMK